MPGPDYIPPPQPMPDWLKEIFKPKPDAPDFDRMVEEIRRKEREREREKVPA